MGLFDIIKGAGKKAAGLAADFIPGGTAAKAGLGALGGLLSGGGLQGALSGGAAGLLGSEKEGARGLGALVLGQQSLAERRKQRESSEQFNQQRLDILRANLEKAESSFDARAPQRQAGQEALLSSLASLGGLTDPFSSGSTKKKGLKAGEFSQREATANG